MTDSEIGKAVESFLISALGAEEPCRVGLLLVAYGLDFMAPTLGREGAAAIIEDFVQAVRGNAASTALADRMLAETLQVRH